MMDEREREGDQTQSINHLLVTFGPSARSAIHTSRHITTTELSDRFPVFETSTTALCSSTDIQLMSYDMDGIETISYMFI